MGMLEKNAWDARADILLISEPNKKMIEKAQWFKDRKGDAAIRVVNRETKIFGEGAGDGFVFTKAKEVTIYSCYSSPNCTEGEFTIFLQAFGESIRRYGRKAVIGGDFNAPSPMWGASVENNRGRKMLEWIAQNHLVIYNKGRQPTFKRGEQESHMDLTLSTENVANRIVKWTVQADEENFSDHQNITFEIQSEGASQETKGKGQRTGWTFNSKRTHEFGKALRKNIEEEKKQNGDEVCAEQWQRAITKACDVVFKKRKNNPSGRRPVWCWSGDVAEARRVCLKNKRVMTRRNKVRHATTEEKQEAYKRYMKSSKDLRIKIKEEKDRRWREFCEDLNRDIWGDAFKIACGRCRILPKITLTDRELAREVEKLFTEARHSKKGKYGFMR
jgi:hypothetical protein